MTLQAPVLQENTSRFLFTLKGCTRCAGDICHGCSFVDSHCIQCGHVDAIIPDYILTEIADSRGKRWLKQDDLLMKAWEGQK